LGWGEFPIKPAGGHKNIHAVATEKLPSLEGRLAMGMPSALASAERTMTPPSLWESTTTGLLASAGAKTFSHDA